MVGPGLGRKHNRKHRVANKCEKEFGKRSRNRFGHPRALLFEAWGSWVVTLATLVVTLGTPGVTFSTRGRYFGHPWSHIGHPRGHFEAQGSKKWFPSMIGFRNATILELPGVIWEAFWGHFGVLLGSFFGIFSRCVFDPIFGNFGHRFWSQNGCKIGIFLRKSCVLTAKVGPSILNNPPMKIIAFQVLGHVKA